LIDGHSFPSRPLPYEAEQSPGRPEICVGTDPYHTPSWLRDLAVAAFERQGFRVAVDRPFSGALVPMAFYGTDARVAAFMVEVNRGLYMDERTGERAGPFVELRRRVRDALTHVIDTWSAR
jgi:N-formylglutamate amidohydrolase